MLDCVFFVCACRSCSLRVFSGCLALALLHMRLLCVCVCGFSVVFFRWAFSRFRFVFYVSRLVVIVLLLFEFVYLFAFCLFVSFWCDLIGGWFYFSKLVWLFCAFVWSLLLLSFRSFVLVVWSCLVVFSYESCLFV